MGLEVGKVTDLKLLGRNNFKTEIFVDAPYDRYVRGGTLFYNASAVQISLVRRRAQHPIRARKRGDRRRGGVRHSASRSTNQAPAKPGATFPAVRGSGACFSERRRGPQVFYRIHVRPIRSGTWRSDRPVALRGFQIGTVTSRNSGVRRGQRWGVESTPVTIGLEPERLNMQEPDRSP